jgi:hypothetical protein
LVRAFSARARLVMMMMMLGAAGEKEWKNFK